MLSSREPARAGLGNLVTLGILDKSLGKMMGILARRRVETRGGEP